MGNARYSYIIQYSTKHLSNTDLVKFFYDLKGRGNESGIIEQTKSLFLAKSIVEIPTNTLNLWRYLFRKWGCQYSLIETTTRQQATHKVLIFNSSKLKGSNKVRFFYALKGRGSKSGIIKQTNSIYLARSAVLVSVKNYLQVVRFLRDWGCDFITKEVYANEK